MDRTMAVKRLVALAVSGTLILGCTLLAGCSPLGFGEKYLGMFSPQVDSGEAAQRTAEIEILRIPFDPNDSLEPYGAKSQLNRTILPLLYDPLFKTDPRYQYTPYLASGAQESGQSWVVTLRDGVEFGSGARLRAEDVVYSYQQAAGAGLYPQLTALVESCTALDGQRVEFRLRQADKNFPTLLSFPVIPVQAGGEGTPGTGRYTLTVLGRTHTLVRNDNHFDAGSPVQTIQLVELPDDEALLGSLKTGAADMLFSDLSTPEHYSISGRSQPVELGNICYLGFRQGNELLANPAFRQLLGSYLNRDTMAAQVYANRAVAAVGPFPPTYYDLPAGRRETPLTSEERSIAFDNLGLDQRDDQGYRLLDGQRVRLELLISGESEYRTTMAALIARQLEGAGVEVSITQLPYEGYRQALAAGRYDLFLGEIRLGENMDLTPLLVGSTLGVADSVLDEGLVAAYQSYRSGVGSCADFLARFAESQPILPLVYRRGMVAYSHLVPSSMVATYQDIFYSLSKW